MEIYLPVTSLRHNADLGGGSAVYRVFGDGHEELVRADIAPVPLSAFKEMLGVGDTPGVYHSAFIPLAESLISRGQNSQLLVVSYVVPSLSFEEVSLKEPTGVAPKLPIVPSPLRASADVRAH